MLRQNCDSPNQRYSWLEQSGEILRGVNVESMTRGGPKMLPRQRHMNSSVGVSTLPTRTESGARVILPDKQTASSGLTLACNRVSQPIGLGYLTNYISCGVVYGRHRTQNSHEILGRGLEEASWSRSKKIFWHFLWETEENHEIGERLLHIVFIVLSSSSWSGVGLSPLGTSATNWPIVPAPDDRWWWKRSSRWNENWQGKSKYSEKNCSNDLTSHISWPGLQPGPLRREAGD
jgi:hypothetical protein